MKTAILAFALLLLIAGPAAAKADLSMSVAGGTPAQHTAHVSSPGDLAILVEVDGQPVDASGLPLP